MRKEFSTYIEQLAEKNDDIIFITGDLGYNALEGVSEKLGGHFINAGVAEQNMMGMAAGMASQGFRVICYSIAPFIVYRCLEQIRNDVCFHNMPVFIVGNGGGYGYGIMGSSHHAIEDIAALSSLPNMTCYIPAFIEDMYKCMDDIFAAKKPAYLRLGLGKNIPPGYTLKPYGAAFENLNAAFTIITQGPVTNNLVGALKEHTHKDEVAIFVINKMPFYTLPDDISKSISRSGKVLVIEEHVSVGGLGSAVALCINQQGLPVDKFISLHAQGYPNGLYGSQDYHQQISGLDEKSIAQTINSYF